MKIAKIIGLAVVTGLFVLYTINLVAMLINGIPSIGHFLGALFAGLVMLAIMQRLLRSIRTQ